MVAAGWPALSADPAYGGQGMPAVVGMAFGQFTAGASAAFSMYPGLTAGAHAGIHANASEELKAKYLPKMTTGEWGGTMNLTEPQCGTDLGMVRTKAVPQGDGTYKITGQKIWISAGEHDFAENIIHIRPGPRRRRSGRDQGSVPVPGAQDLRQRGRLARRAQRRPLRRPRAQDGHPRQRHLRHGL
jgi:alkylation response protein AidB-like acyl-CoA dehydrogenase